MDLLHARVSIPDGVVYRSFARETVMLNLDTGRYHGLNRTAATMLDVLGEGLTVTEAAERLAPVYGQPPATILRDLCSLCETLAERNLILITSDPKHAEAGPGASQA